MSAFVIARLTFKEASRRWVIWAALLLGGIFLLVYALGFREIHREIVVESALSPRIMAREIYNFILMAGMYVVNFLIVIMTVLTSVDTLSGEIASGTVHTLVSKPIQRWEIVAGKWLGFMGMLTPYLLLMAGGVLAVVYFTSGYLPPNPLRGIGLLWLNIALLLSLSLLGGAFMSTLANGVMVFGLYSIAFIGGWIEQIGSFLDNETAVNIGILSSLIIPTESIWKRASYEMQSVVVSAVGGVSPFSSTTIPSPLMVMYAVLYAATAFFLAIRLFSRRDL
jgi:Cu-processing system permease protein